MASHADGVEPPRRLRRLGSSDARAPDDISTDDEPGWVEGVRRDRPVLYASRHLIKPVVTLLLAVLGVGALLRALLPRFDIDVEWLRVWGEERLSWVPDPLGWAARWVRSLFGDLQLAEWVGSVMRTAKWWIPILVALAAATNEVNRRWTASTTDESAPTDEDVAEGEDDNGTDGPALGSEKPS